MSAATAALTPEDTSKPVPELAKVVMGILGAATAGAASAKTGVGGGVIDSASSNYVNILTMLSGIFSSKGENGETLNKAAEGINTAHALATVANGVNKFVSGKQGASATVGDMVEGIVGYANFKDNMENGDGVAWNTVKTFILKKTLGFLAEKAADLLINNNTTIKSAADKVTKFARGEGAEQAAGAAVAAAPTPAVPGAARTAAQGAS